MVVLAHIKHLNIQHLHLCFCSKVLASKYKNSYTNKNIKSFIYCKIILLLMQFIQIVPFSGLGILTANWCFARRLLVKIIFFGVLTYFSTKKKEGKNIQK